MLSQACNSIRESLLAYLGEQTNVHEVDGECIVTVPMNTIDNRWVDITVETRGEFFRVHDSGKSSDELFLQGVSLSDKKTDVLKNIASRFGVDVVDGNFIVGCKADQLQHSIWAVAHCSGLAMAELLRHKPNLEDEAIKTAVEGVIASWALRTHSRFQLAVSARGQTSVHTFDFVAARDSGVVAVNVLLPGAHSLGRAQRYGFQVFDTRESYKTYKRMAIMANSRTWSTEARSIVNQMAHEVIEYVSPALATSTIVGSLNRLLQVTQ